MSLDLTVGDVKIETLTGLDETARAVLKHELVKRNWTYAWLILQDDGRDVLEPRDDQTAHFVQVPE